jgi:4'-phosphopantetheinyl transferase
VIIISRGANAMPLPLNEDEVHVWHARLDELTGQHRRMAALLNGEERARATRFRIERDRIHFRLARGILRSLLSDYGSVPPKEIALGYSPTGKPVLTNPQHQDLQFNLSHSHGMAVFAFGRGRRVGIDVELAREMKDADNIVQRYFSPEEITAYQALPAETRLSGFFNGWVRKEAFVKALGEGLGHPLAAFTVSLVPTEPARLLSIAGDQAAAAGWTLCDLDIDPGYACALVAEGGPLRVSCRAWPGAWHPAPP